MSDDNDICEYSSFEVIHKCDGMIIRERVIMAKSAEHAIQLYLDALPSSHPCPPDKRGWLVKAKRVYR